MDGGWIVIANFNGRRWLPGCLSSLAETLPESTSVLVVDNGSTDGSVEFIREHFGNVGVLELGNNVGFLHASNLGVWYARREGASHVVLLNNDTEATPGWYEALINAARENPDFGILGPLQKSFDDTPSPRTQAIVRNWQSTDADVQALPSVVPTDWVEGSCMLVRASVFDRIGFLDPLFAPAYYEEVDFCRRARQQGIGVGLASQSVIRHFGAGSSQEVRKRSWQRSLEERNYLLFHAGAGRPLGWLYQRVFSHGIRSVMNGRLTLFEWLAALAGLPTRYRPLNVKTARDRDHLPCPIEGTALPETDDVRCLLEHMERIEKREPVTTGDER